MRKNDYVFRYRVRNWHNYNRALVARGRLTFWFDEDAIAGWRNTELRSGPGTPKFYSDVLVHRIFTLIFDIDLMAKYQRHGPVAKNISFSNHLLYAARFQRNDGQVSSACLIADLKPNHGTGILRNRHLGSSTRCASRPSRSWLESRKLTGWLHNAVDLTWCLASKRRMGPVLIVPVLK